MNGDINNYENFNEANNSEQKKIEKKQRMSWMWLMFVMNEKHFQEVVLFIGARVEGETWRELVM